MITYILRAVGMYFMALIMIRLLGKRALGQLGPFDFVVMTGVGFTVVSVALERSIPFSEGVIILCTLAVLEYTMGYLSLKNQNLSNIITGKPVTLVSNGRIIKENLAREKFNIDDLMQELRKRGIRDLDEVEAGILEPGGGFSVILRERDEPVSRRDLEVNPVSRSEILTFTPINRRDFFNLQREESVQEQGFPLPQILNNIEQSLRQIDARLTTLEKKIK